MKQKIAKIFGTYLSETETIRGLFKKVAHQGKPDAMSINEILVVFCEEIDMMIDNQKEILERLLELESREFKVTKAKK